MIYKDSIIIKNIYYMLAYAFKLLNQEDLEKCGTENFDDALEMLTVLLLRGTDLLIKKGLYKSYKEICNDIDGVKGKININETINTCSLAKRKLVCEFDVYTNDILMNRIIKTTLTKLLKVNELREYGSRIRKTLSNFFDVEFINLENVSWRFQFDRNNKIYAILMMICRMLHKGLIQNENNDGATLFSFDISDESFGKLFERFILEYYRSKDINALKKDIAWNITGPCDLTYLPRMESDILIEKKTKESKKILIIDAKFYKTNMSTRSEFNSIKNISKHLYQIFTYVNNYKAKHPESEVTGMMLYAKTNDKIQPDSEYYLSNNKYIFTNIDLNSDFKNIKAALDNIVYNL